MKATKFASIPYQPRIPGRLADIPYEPRLVPVERPAPTMAVYAPVIPYEPRFGVSQRPAPSRAVYAPTLPATPAPAQRVAHGPKGPVVLASVPMPEIEVEVEVEKCATCRGYKAVPPCRSCSGTGIRMVPRPVEPPADTQSAAHAVSKSRAGQDRQRILSLVAEEGGLTTDQVEELLGLPHQTASARTSELKAAGLLVDSTERRLTRAGCYAAVLTITTAGMAVAS